MFITWLFRLFIVVVSLYNGNLTGKGEENYYKSKHWSMMKIG